MCLAQQPIRLTLDLDTLESRQYDTDEVLLDDPDLADLERNLGQRPLIGQHRQLHTHFLEQVRHPALDLAQAGPGPLAQHQEHALFHFQRRQIALVELALLLKTA
ncbi:hypothetical protein A8U91_00667 [Halomonas elongata]|uniref:Uncharacterized protein n=1 Tax=Halomonas elongata TaxID=2746 RepID=A0A1B8P224_HALEL|nr:hypothetical protein [Halomonas elongata]OBX36326.1 hypothetical protein A8U91_00667 [Halomonas elongata]